MDEVVLALEGGVAPMTCFVAEDGQSSHGRVVCNHEADSGHGCATKLLWTRVQGGVVKALAQTTLAELVAFSNRTIPIPPPSRPTARPRWLETQKDTYMAAELEIRNLHVQAGEKQILKGLDLTVNKGEIHALMGPNGSGKSTLANAIMGHPGLEVTEGQILFQGEDITEADPDERARAGLFMAFQYPVAIPGVTITKYLRMVLNAHREARGEEEISLKDFRKTVEAAMELTNVPREFVSRYLNDGFSGGEKKRLEMLQLALQQPRARRPGRDRLRPGHRRAQRRRPRRQHDRQGLRHGRADHHPLPAHPAPGRADSACRSCSTAGSSRRAGPELVEQLETEGYGRHQARRRASAA